MAEKLAPANKNKRKIGGLRLRDDRPTKAKVPALFEWVIWEFPIRRQGWVVAAVHPPQGGFGWYPALVDRAMAQIKILAQQESPFDSPESARDFLLAAE